jgi:hypothetical protein
VVRVFAYVGGRRGNLPSFILTSAYGHEAAAWLVSAGHQLVPDVIEFYVRHCVLEWCIEYAVKC